MFKSSSSLRGIFDTISSAVSGQMGFRPSNLEYFPLCCMLASTSVITTWGLNTLVGERVGVAVNGLEASRLCAAQNWAGYLVLELTGRCKGGTAFSIIQFFTTSLEVLEWLQSHVSLRRRAVAIEDLKVARETFEDVRLRLQILSEIVLKQPRACLGCRGC